MIISNNLATKTIEELAILIHAKKISPVDVTTDVFQQINTYNQSINAYIARYEEQALIDAKRSEEEIFKGNYRGNLHGIPMGIKDNLYFENQITTMGSKIHANFKPRYDATVIKRLKKAGVIFTGKLNMHEYALGGTTNNLHFGPTRNPWNVEKIPGGSSGGSGAAIAADMTIASLGSDTSGSIAIPASACGIVGLKPTYGRVSKYGCFPEAWSLDHVGPMSKTVYDAALLLAEIEGFDAKDPASIDVPLVSYNNFKNASIKGMVVGIEENYFLDKVDPAIKDIVLKTVDKLKNMGALIEIVKIPTLDAVEFAVDVTDLSELATVHYKTFKERPEDYGADVKHVIESGLKQTAVDYIEAQRIRKYLKKDFKEVFKKVDVLISPALPSLPPTIGEKAMTEEGHRANYSRFPGPANLTGLPSLTLPGGLSGGMPVGIQLIGPAFQEEKILKIGQAIENMLPLAGNKPELSARF